MEKDTEDIDDINCTQLPKDQLLKIAITYSATGGVGVLVSSVILIVLLSARAYKTVLQRLIVYSTLMVLFQDCCHLANMFLAYPNATQLEDSTGCAWLGFLANWSGWSEYMSYSVIILYLLGVVCVQVKGSSLQAQREFKVWKIVSELGAVLLIVLFPGLVLWKPLYDKKYGLDNGFCFFKTKCSEKPQFLYVFFFNMLTYEAVPLLCLGIALGLLMVYCKLSSKLKRAKLMMKYLSFLLTTVILNSIALNLVLVSFRGKSIAYKLLLFGAIFATADDFFILGGFLLVFHFFKLSTMCKKVAERISKQKTLIRPQNDGTNYKTFQESNRESDPSETYFNIEYTGEFTAIAAQD